MTDKALPGVVQILAEVGDPAAERMRMQDLPDQFRNFFNLTEDERWRAIGSGFMVEPAGTVVTNSHVADVAEAVRVRLYDGTELPATLLGRDVEADLAVLEIPAEQATPMGWGDSDALGAGSIVLALGSPFGLRNSVTQGIVSGVRVARRDAGGIQYLQTDASISPGNSGGPLVNIRGEVVGINTWITAPGLATDTMGFAIPSNEAQRLVAEMRAGGGARPSWLGVLSVADADTPGMLITHVFPRTPADRANLRVGDVLVQLEDYDTNSRATLAEAIEGFDPDEYLTLVLDGERISAVTVGARPLSFLASWLQDANVVQRYPPPLEGEEAALFARLAEYTERLAAPVSTPQRALLTRARALVRAGVAEAAARELLAAPPVTLETWVDYTHAEDKRLVQRLRRLAKRYAPLVHTVVRYAPRPGTDAYTAETIALALERARALGRFSDAQAYIVQQGAFEVGQLVEGMLQRLRIDAEVFEAAYPREQVVVQLAADALPAIQRVVLGDSADALVLFNGERVNAAGDEAALGARIERLLLRQAL